MIGHSVSKPLRLSSLEQHCDAGSYISAIISAYAPYLDAQNDLAWRGNTCATHT